MLNIYPKIKDIYRKNKQDIHGILFKKYPDFILKKTSNLEIGEIPVFVFHSVISEKFEKQLKYLSDNNYKTISTDTLINIITGKIKPIEKAVVLTFDDGRASLWSIAYPLLKKYRFVGVSFIIPFLVESKDEYYPNLDDVWQGSALVQEISDREKVLPLCTWEEIKKMHDSGVIDFQSHTLSHSSVFISNKLVNFVNPDFQPSPLHNTFNPWVIKEGSEILLESSEWGFPIYESDSSMSAKNRYIENEDVSKTCIEYVKNHGGLNFFKKQDWEKQIKRVWKKAQLFYEKKKLFQNTDERYKDIEKELFISKKEIETKLNKIVNHLCYPWYGGSDLSIQISKKIGYKSNFWGMLEGGAINSVGDNPFYLKRLDENYIFSLPGVDRKSLFKIQKEKFVSQ